MEFDIVPQIIIVFSMGIVILILGKNISKVKENPDDFLFENGDEKKEKEKFLYLCERLTRRVNKKKYQEKVGLFWIWFEKVLRKLRINFLRLDNKIVSALDRVKEKNIENENVENEIEAENKNQWQECSKPKDDDVKLKDENMYTDNKKIEKSFNDDDKNTGDNFDLTTENKTPTVSNITDKEEISDKSDKDVAEMNKLNTENKNRKEKEYIDLISKNPVDIKSYWKLGIVYSRKKNYKDAISCFRQITKIDPTYTKAKKKITDLMKRMKRDKK